jgi:hypothetical protein
MPNMEMENVLVLQQNLPVIKNLAPGHKGRPLHGGVAFLLTHKDRFPLVRQIGWKTHQKNMEIKGSRESARGPFRPKTL